MLPLTRSTLALVVVATALLTILVLAAAPLAAIASNGAVGGP